jgi:hypothetical protein
LIRERVMAPDGSRISAASRARKREEIEHYLEVLGKADDATDADHVAAEKARIRAAVAAFEG